MDISILGRSYFTEDGFDIENYDQHDLSRAISKINGHSLETQQIAIVASRSNPASMPIIATYSEELLPLISPSNFLSHFEKGKLTPMINGIVVPKSSDVKLLGYANREEVIVAIKSHDESVKGLMCMYTYIFLGWYREILNELLKIIPTYFSMQVIGCPIGFQSRGCEQVTVTEYPLSQEQAFEIYTEEDDGEDGSMKNYVVTF